MTKASTVEQVLELVAQYNRKMYKYGKDYRHYGTGHNLRADQIHLIDLIGRNPGCNLRYLADALESGVPTVSLQVDRLNKMGLVTKRRSLTNQREIEINLTEDGQLTFRHHSQLDQDYFSTATKGLSQYSEDQLATILDFLNNLLKNDLNF